MNHRMSLPSVRQEGATRALPGLAPCRPLRRLAERLLARAAIALQRAEKTVTERFRVPPNGA